MRGERSPVLAAAWSEGELLRDNTTGGCEARCVRSGAQGDRTAACSSAVPTGRRQRLGGGIAGRRCLCLRHSDLRAAAGETSIVQMGDPASWIWERKAGSVDGQRRDRRRQECWGRDEGAAELQGSSRLSRLQRPVAHARLHGG